MYIPPMILAGIDEAGYGPMLGPLVVGSCAFEISDVGPTDDSLPCLWKRLRKCVARNRCKRGKRIHVNDSKQVYSPSTGLKELEKSVLAVLAAMDGFCPDRLDDFVRRTAEHAIADLAEHDWYIPDADERFPIEQDASAVRVLANGLRVEMARCGARCVHLSARVVPERAFNRMVRQTHNKASALFSIGAVHLDHLLRTYGDQHLTIFCDRQGGRGYYGSLLRLMFDEWDLQIISEADEGRSEYRLLNRGRVVRIIFCEKAEEQCMPVALASMLSKYLREAMMRRFNAYWRHRLPDLAPTAGYYGDGARFLADVDATRRQMGIADDDLIRCR
jgi:hypothetical protein